MVRSHMCAKTCIHKHDNANGENVLQMFSYECLHTPFFLPLGGALQFSYLSIGHGNSPSHIVQTTDNLSALEGNARLVLNGPNRAANLWSRDSY